MAVKDVFKVYLYPDPLSGGIYLDELGEDITDGILNVDIVSGTDLYEGPQQQIDTGQFTIVSRNPNLDPKFNPNLKYNSRIAFHDTRGGEFGNEFFRGYVTSINVEYQRNDNPIITITGTDIFGVLQRTLVNQTLYNQIIALSDGPSWDGVDFETFIAMPEVYNLFSNKYYTQEMMDTAFISNDGGQIASSSIPFRIYSNQLSKNVSFGNEVVEGNLGYMPAKYIPEVGESLLEIINKYASTNLNYISTRNQEWGFNFISVYPFMKYDGEYWNHQQDPLTQYTTYDFSSDPIDDAPYESILVSNGFDRVINQIQVSNEYKTLDGTSTVSNTNEYSYSSAQSLDDYAVSKLNISTIFPDSHDLPLNAMATRIATDIFQVVASPSDQVQRITFDNARYEDIQNEQTKSFYNFNKIIRVKHRVTPTETIDNVYDIAGIQHSISPDAWTTTFTLKPSAQQIVFNYQGYTPEIQMNSKTGDTNFNFTATIANYPIEDISVVVWCLNAPEASESFPGGKGLGPYYYASTLNGERYKVGYPPIGLTETWNFDDDGILAPYNLVGPITNQFGGYGPGYWTVYAYIRLKNGFNVIAETELIVGTPVVEADFTWQQNLTNNFGQVQFTNTSVNHETGEPDSYLWDFGDGTTSAEANPIHTYDPGPSDTEYDVSLTVYAYGPGGTKVYNTYTPTITLAQPTMVPNFTYTQNQQTITFTNTSTNVGFEEPDAYFWDFGDGTTSTLKNPVKTYGVSEDVTTSFNVTLTTRNIWEQTASTTKTVTVTAVNASGNFPVRYIKLKIDQYTRLDPVTGSYYFAVTPVMKFMKALTSGTGANLIYLKPLLGFNDNSVPTVSWKATSGGSPQQSQGWEYYLTRDPAVVTNPLYYGLGVASQASVYEDYRTVRWELVLDLQGPIYTINQIDLIFQDLYQSSGAYAGLHIEDFYPKISVEFADTVTNTYTPNPSGVYGPPTLNGNWINVGYFKLPGGRMDPTKPVGQRTEATKTMFAMRPLPLNIPYFNYTFNDKTVSFTSIETADSYLWTFGDGTTSTLKNPVKTYASYNTYNVTLQVTNGGIVTRTTTEPVIVQAPVI